MTIRVFAIVLLLIGMASTCLSAEGPFNPHPKPPCDPGQTPMKPCALT